MSGAGSMLKMLIALIFFSLCCAKDICNNETICFPEMFIPTNEFQMIHPDQVVPPGLHLRIDLKSGLKEGKLLEQTKISERSSESSLTIQEKSSLDQLLKDIQNQHALLENLEFLSEISHDIDVGEELTSKDAFSRISSLLDHDSNLVKQQIVLIIGNAVSVLYNN